MEFFSIHSVWQLLVVVSTCRQYVKGGNFLPYMLLLTTVSVCMLAVDSPDRLFVTVVAVGYGLVCNLFGRRNDGWTALFFYALVTFYGGVYITQCTNVSRAPNRDESLCKLAATYAPLTLFWGSGDRRSRVTSMLGTGVECSTTRLCAKGTAFCKIAHRDERVSRGACGQNFNMSIEAEGKNSENVFAILDIPGLQRVDQKKHGFIKNSMETEALNVMVMAVMPYYSVIWSQFYVPGVRLQLNPSMEFFEDDFRRASFVGTIGKFYMIAHVLSWYTGMAVVQFLRGTFDVFKYGHFMKHRHVSKDDMDSFYYILGQLTNPWVWFAYGVTFAVGYRSYLDPLFRTPVLDTLLVLVVAALALLLTAHADLFVDPPVRVE